ncbi:MAG: DUF2330 domain-containing protein [Myxococcales bacterium]|nr:DUF2330 domain-containing protein [Myxococcales bacterium]
MTNFLQVVAVLVGAAVLSFSARAEACGCFAQPPQSLGTPVVQAGERILFAVDNGKVTAHIQIQYSGDAKEFGWLIPLPSVPVVKVGSEELFTLLLRQTQPTYQTTTVFTGEGCQRQASPGLSFGCQNRAAAFSPSAGRFEDSAAAPQAPPSPLVIQATVGPYDYAVLKADDRAAMVTWLADNRYVIPTGADDVVAPYIRPGAYFLALKLTSGASTGDIAPVVLEYASDLPMIPITLTSIGAQPNMGVQVWLVGPGRAIPRNYHHVVINDAQLDWANGAGNYSAVVTAAVATAPTKHAFVTEYAGTSTVMRDTLVPPGRFGTVEALAAETTPHGFVRRLFESGFSSGRTLPSQVKRVVLAAVPYPPALQQRGISEDQFLNDLEYYLGTFRTQNPDVFVNYQLSFDAPIQARELFSTFVAPLREANALFTTFPTLTRLYTTLSPADMNRDPVFSFNSSLPEVSKDHTATIERSCVGTTLVTEQGYRTPVETGAAPLPGPASATMTSATRLETLGEEGPATVLVDNAAAITAALAPPPAAPSMPTGGCAAVDPTSLALVVLVARLRRRRP